MRRLTEIDRQALEFLMLGPDTPGAVTDENILAAHFVFLGLVKDGLVFNDPGDDGPTYTIAPAGRAVLADPDTDQGRKA